MRLFWLFVILSAIGGLAIYLHMIALVPALVWFVATLLVVAIANEVNDGD